MFRNDLWPYQIIIFIFSRRLSSNKINLTVHESQFENSKVMDVRVHLASSVINIRYGTDPVREKTRLLRHVARTLSRRAWAREQDIVSGAAPGSWSVEWRDREITQILSGDEVTGYDVEYRHSPILYPDLASDILNVVFTRTNKRRSRHWISTKISFFQWNMKCKTKVLSSIVKSHFASQRYFSPDLTVNTKV